MTKPPYAARVFISYAHDDGAHLAALHTHLDSLRREGWIDTWDDRQIPAGVDWEKAIYAKLNEADIILLLISANFIASNFCYEKELQRALERLVDSTDRAVVIPVILSSCDWEAQNFARLQALPCPSKGIDSKDWNSADQYYTAVAKGLRERLRTLRDVDQSWEARTWGRLRDPRWWQQPRIWGKALAVVLILAIGWHLQSSLTDELDLAVQDMRTGHYADADQKANHACQGLYTFWPNCHALQDKLEKLRTLHTMPDGHALALFETQVAHMEAAHPADPDWQFLHAALRLRTPEVAADKEQARDAVEKILQAIKQAGAVYPEAQFYLGTLYLSAGQYEHARALLDLAVRGNSQSPVYRSARAYAWMRQGQLGKADADYQMIAANATQAQLDWAALLWHGPSSRPEAERLKQAQAQLHAAQTRLRQAATDHRPPSDDKSAYAYDALPWLYDLGPEQNPLILHSWAEKRCMADWLMASTKILAGAERQSPPGGDCGVNADAMPRAVLRILQLDDLPAPSRQRQLAAWLRAPRAGD